MKKAISFIAKTWLIIFTTFIYISSAFSQDFEVAPTKLEYTCEPGQIQTKTITIRNHSNSKQLFNLIPGYIEKDSLGKASAKINPEHSCTDWITLNPTTFTLNSNESSEVKAIMQVPPGHSETRWCVIYVTPTEEKTSIAADQAMKTGIKVNPRISIRVTQSPKSNTNFKGAISDFKEITTAKDTTRKFQVKISNTGDKIINGRVYLILSDLGTAKEIKAKPIKVNLLPANKKMITLYMPAKVPPGRYSAAAILDYGNNSALEAVQLDIEVK